MENPKKPDLLDEWRRGRGTWAAVGKHMRWRKEVEELGVSVGRRLLGVRDGGELPPVGLLEHSLQGSRSAAIDKLMNSTSAYIYEEAVRLHSDQRRRVTWARWHPTTARSNDVIIADPYQIFRKNGWTSVLDTTASLHINCSAQYTIMRACAFSM